MGIGTSMKRWFKTASIVFVGLLGVEASATDVAILRNGFTIRHESRAPLGATTRLFLTPDGSSFVDVPTAEIVEIDKNVGPAPGTETTAPPAVAPPGISTPLPTASPAPAAQRVAAPAPASVSVQTPAASVDLSQTVNAAGERYRLDPDFINSVIRAESGFKVHAVSPKGAQGLMQLMPRTASALGVRNAFDPYQNIEGGVRHLRYLLDRYPGNVPLALAAYNAGEKAVDYYHGIPPFAETTQYVQKILGQSPSLGSGGRSTVIYRYIERDGTMTITNVPRGSAISFR